MEILTKEQFIKATTAYMEHKRKVKAKQFYDFINFKRGVFRAINRRLNNGR